MVANTACISLNWRKKQINIQIRSDNIRAIRFNQSLGYTYDEELGENWYSLTKERYLKKSAKIKSIINYRKGER
jgi:RimJ/RimL family protein N-acetyltransferase